MEIQVALIILLIAAIVACLAIYLIATIGELFKINAGLDIVLGKVGEIVQKSSPVNPVVDDINAQLVIARDALEGLHVKKAGPDAAGLVESLFPGEGANFLRRVGKTGKVVNSGAVYTRGVAILASLGRGAPIGAAHAKGPAVRDPKYQTSEVSKLYPAPPTRRDPKRKIPKSPVVGREAAHSPYEPALTPGTRPRDAAGRKIETPPPAPTGVIAVAPSTPAPAAPPPAAPEPPSDPGRLSAKGKRPWER